MTKLTPAARKARLSLWTSRLAFGTGVLVSLTANVMAVQHTPIGIAVGIWVPIAFLISMSLIENVVAKGWLGTVRKVGVIFIALIAGGSSYFHLVEVCRLGGADILTSHLLPLTVDVMMALASPGLKAKAAAAPARRRPAAKAKPAKLRSVA